MEKTVKILICDENAEERKKIADAVFKSGGKRPDEAADGDEALELVGRNRYDIVMFFCKIRLADDLIVHFYIAGKFLRDQGG